MKRIVIIVSSVSLLLVIIYLLRFTGMTGFFGDSSSTLDSLPDVFTENHSDLVAARLKHEAVLKFAQHQVPKTRQEWETYSANLKRQVIEKAGIVIDHDLPLNYRETGVKEMDGYTIKNIAFQTRPGVYATANLYIPDGEGPFPAVISMHGHWAGGRVHEVPQSRGPSLALNGYVCLSVDAFGSGERTTIHGEDEYHGGNLGASLFNIGESLLGIQVSDNMRGVDLLASLPFVDPDNIGATGASGGGNQTFWLTAIDERIKASMPVVSVGTFESVIMRSNCVCETLVDGFTLSEASGILAMIAPRAIKMCNHKRDSNPTFYPDEMLRTYNNAKPVYKLLGAENNIAYELFDLEHGYMQEDREAMLGWFDLHLKGSGTGDAIKEASFETLPKEQLMVYPTGERDTEVKNIADYCKERGNELRQQLLSTKSFDVTRKKDDLRKMLRINEQPSITKIHRFPGVEKWERFALETSDDKLIPILHMPPTNDSGEYVIVCDPKGKKSVSASLLEEVSQDGAGIVLVDLSGTGEAISSESSSYDQRAALHTMARAELWLGKTTMGEWVKELKLVNNFLSNEFQASKISIDGTREGGVAALFLSALDGNVENITMRNTPVSYLFDEPGGVNYFGMGIHVPEFLKWGDVSLAAALSGKNINYIDPVTMSGSSISNEQLDEYHTEVVLLRAALGETDQELLIR